MLKIIRNWELRDYLRSMEGVRGYGIPIGRNNIAIQWQGAYSDIQRTIQYFLARQIDNGNSVITSYVIDEGRIKYENGQYVYDNTQLFDGYLPDGTYYFEFNDGHETYYSQIFAVVTFPELMLASGGWLASSDELISSVNISDNDLLILERLNEGGVVQIS